MATEHREILIRYKVRIEVNDESAIDRCVKNENEWLDHFYESLTTRDAVLDHFAWNAAVNRVQSANRLDGWADLSPEAVTMMVVSEEEEEGDG